MSENDRVTLLEIWALRAVQYIEQNADYLKLLEQTRPEDYKRLTISDISAESLIKELDAIINGAGEVVTLETDPTTNDVCPDCKGTGAHPLSDINVHIDCPRCLGLGYLLPRYLHKQAE